MSTTSYFLLPSKHGGKIFGVTKLQETFKEKE